MRLERFDLDDTEETLLLDEILDLESLLLEVILFAFTDYEDGRVCILRLELLDEGE